MNCNFFKQDCIKEIDGGKRVGIKEVEKCFNTWCEKNRQKKFSTLKEFREKFEDITGLKRSKVSILGYQIELKI